MSTVTHTMTSMMNGVPCTSTFTLPQAMNYICTVTPTMGVSPATQTTAAPPQCLTTLMQENAALKAQLAALKKKQRDLAASLSNPDPI
jgi:hypothetical protein